VVETSKCGDVSQQFGVGYATRIDGNMDFPLYKDILQDELEQTIEFYDMDPGTVIIPARQRPKTHQ